MASDDPKIEVLDDVVAVIRKRPGMYIGDTGRNGLAHLAYFALDIHFALTRPNRLDAILQRNGTLTIRSDACPSVPMEILERLEECDFRPFNVEDWAWELLCVSALSSKFRICWRNERSGTVWTGRQGRVIRGASTLAKGLPFFETAFAPDPLIFEGQWFDFTSLVARVQELAPLFPGVRVRARDLRSGAEFASTCPDGLTTLVSWWAGVRTRLPKPVVVDETWQGVRIRAALQWAFPNPYGRIVVSYANTVRTRGGGSHELGLVRAIDALKERRFDVSNEGLIAAIAVDGPRNSLRFRGPTRDVLAVDRLEQAVFERVTHAVTKALQRS